MISSRIVASARQSRSSQHMKVHIPRQVHKGDREKRLKKRTGDWPSERLRSSPFREALIIASMVDLSSWMWKAWGGRAESELEPASRRPLSGILREFISADRGGIGICER